MRATLLSRTRSTTPSPLIMGMIETRRSNSRPLCRRVMRPSWGFRFSAMLSPAMILSRLTIAFRNRFTVWGTPASLSTPSIR